MSIIEHCPGEKPSADSPGCEEYFVVQCDVCGECMNAEVDFRLSSILEYTRHLCAKCEKLEDDK